MGRPLVLQFTAKRGIHLTQVPTTSCGWQFCVLENRPRCHGSVIVAARADYQVSLGQPAPATIAPRAYESLRPPKPVNVLAASILCRKARLEFCKRPGVILHGPIYYILWSLESSEYPFTANYYCAIRDLCSTVIDSEKLGFIRR